MNDVPKSIKLRSGNLLVEYEKEKQIEDLLRLNKSHDLKMQVSLHGSPDTCKGVVCCSDLNGLSEQGILQKIRKEGVINLHRITVRRDGTLKGTNSLMFTFNKNN